MTWLAFISSALASSTAGMSLTPLGGGMAGVTETGVLGLPANPAAAASESPELAIDAGINAYAFTAELEGAQAETARGTVPMPYVGVTLPLGRWGLGVYGMIPHGGGVSMDEDGPQRFHAIESQAHVIEGGLAIARSFGPHLTLGASARMGVATLTKDTAMNTAALVNSSADLDNRIDTSDPLWHGRQELDVKGFGIGFGVGANLNLGQEWCLHAAYRSPMKTPVSGTVDLKPSDDLPLALSGEAEGTLTHAQELEVGVSGPVGPTRVSAVGGWTDWRGMNEVDIEVRNLRVSSENSSMESLLTSAGANEADILAAGTDIHSNLGHGSAFHAGAAVAVPLSKRLLLRPAFQYAGTTLPDESFHVGIADFAALDLRLSAAHSTTEWLTIALSVDHFLIADRVITDSSLSFDNTASSGRVLNSANGRYSMNATRAGLTVITRL